jgi:molybdenum cofactor cytidylyltransferase
VIVGIVLAAGAGARFGGAKVVAPFRGIAVVRHVVDRLFAGGVASVLVAAGEHEGAIREALLGTEATIVPVADAGSGMSASLSAAVAALPDAAAGFCVALGDQPLIDPALVQRLRDTWGSSNAAAVVPMYRGRVPGHPVFFDATMRSRLQGLQGDRGARDLLSSMGDRVSWLDVDQAAPVDIDTPDDLRRLEP